MNASHESSKLLAAVRRSQDFHALESAVLTTVSTKRGATLRGPIDLDIGLETPHGIAAAMLAILHARSGARPSMTEGLVCS